MEKIQPENTYRFAREAEKKDETAATFYESIYARYDTRDPTKSLPTG